MSQPPPSYAESKSRIPFSTNPLSAFHNPFARDSAGSRPSSPAPSDAGDGESRVRRPISRKHVEQAVRLFGETLQEDLACDYAFDLHFSALDYSLKALPEGSFEDSPARKANIRRRLAKLIEQVGADGAMATQPESKWWQPSLPFSGQAAPPVPTSGPDGSFELLGTCPSCTTRVPVQVPAWMAKGNAPKKQPATFEELAVSAVVGFAVFIKQSPIPLLLTSFFSALMQAMLYLDARFAVHQRFLLLLGGIIEALVVLDRELGVLRKCGDLLHKLWEIGISAMLAFAKAEGYSGSTRTAGSLTPVSAPALSPDLGPTPSLHATAPTPRRQVSQQGHLPRNSWPKQDLSPAPLASTSSSLRVRGLRSPASYDTIRHAVVDTASPDTDEAVAGTRRREDSWTGRVVDRLNFVPGRRGT